MNEKEQKLLTGIKTILENYEKGIFNSKEFVFFAIPPETKLTLQALTKFIENNIAEQLYFTHSPVEARPHRTNENNFFKKNEEKYLIPMIYKCFPQAYEKLISDLKNYNGVFSLDACIAFIKTSPNTLLAKLLATYLLSEINFSKKESGLEKENEMLQKASKLEIPEYSYNHNKSTAEYSPVDTQKSESEDSKKIIVFEKPLEKVIKAGPELLQTETHIPANSSASTSSSYSSAFFEKTKEPSNQVEETHQKDSTEKLKKINQLLTDQQAARQKLAADHQKQLQELLLNQSKEKENLEAKQEKERQAFFGFEQPTSTLDSKEFGVNLSAST